MAKSLSYILLTLAAAGVVGLAIHRLWQDRYVLPSGQSATPASIETAPSTTSADKHIGPVRTPSFPDTVEIPPRYQLPGVASVRTADDFDAWMSKYPLDERKHIEAFADRYYGVYEISSAEQIAWMAQAGYPMPEDLIVAAGMSNAELQDLVSKGNVKAAILLSDRDLGAAIEKLKQLDPASQEAKEARSSNFSSLATVLNSNTPFKGYAEAADAMYLNQDRDARASEVAAGLIRSAALGDTRAADVLSEYADAGVISDQELITALRIYVDLGGDQIRLRSLENCPLIRPIPSK